MKLHEIAGGLDQRIQQLKSNIAAMTQDAQYADTSQHQSQLDRMQSELHALEQQKRVQSGEEVQTSFTIPEDQAKRIHSKLQQMWKVSPGFDVPWHMYHGKTPGTIDIRVQGRPDYRHGGANVRQMVDYLKQHEVNHPTR